MPDDASGPSTQKSRLLTALRERVTVELRSLRDSQRAAQDGATHEETRQEDPKDTRAIEAQYVARGFAERVEELQQTLAALERFRLGAFDERTPIAPSALVTVLDEHTDDERVYFVVPVAGGETLDVGGLRVRTVTPASPLGRALCGRALDDEIRLELPGRTLQATIVRVV